MKKFSGFAACILLACVLSSHVAAQPRSVDDLYSDIEKLVEEGKHPGMPLFKMRPELKSLELKGREALKGGLLLHYAQCKDEAIEALEKFRAEFPGSETPEVVAALAKDYALTSQLAKAEEMERIWREKYPDNKERFRFSRYERMVDAIDHSLLVCYARVGTPEQVFRKIEEMIAVRDRDKPESYPSSTLIDLGTDLRAVLGRYDEALEFIKQELPKFEKGSNFCERLLLAKVKVEYSRIAGESGFQKALEHFKAARELFQDKYVLRKYENELASAEKAGKPMFTLNVTDWLKYDPAVENLEGKVILLDLFTSTWHACREGFPHLAELYNKYKDDGLVIIGATRHTGTVASYHGESFKKLEYERERELMTQFVEDFGGTFPVAIEREKTNFENYDVRFIPTLVLIDKTGKIQKVGFMYGIMLEERIRQLLAE